MEIVARIAELIGFDILFLGGITLVAYCIAAELWHEPRLRAVASLACQTKICALFSTTSGDPKPGVFHYTSLLLAAALVGMLINVGADRALESDQIQKILNWPFEPWPSEDRIKAEAMKTTAGLITAGHVLTILRNHPGSYGPSRHPGLEPAKAFLQHAYPSIQKAEKASILPTLRYEFLVVKVLRVLLLLVVALYLVILARAILTTGKKTWRGRVVTIVVATVLVATCSRLFLCLWYAQSSRYYKKVIHAYIVVAAEEDRALVNYKPPLPSDH